MTAIAIQHRTEILEQIASGIPVTTIARAFGLSNHVAISKVLAHDPEYVAARQAGLEARMDLREGELETASASVTVARARELLNHARWRAERECPAVWGQRSTVQVEPVLMVHVVRVEPQVIPDESQRVDPATPQLPDSVK